MTPKQKAILELQEILGNQMNELIWERDRLRKALEEIAELGDVRADEASYIARTALTNGYGETP